LTERLGLQDKVRFQVGDALALPFPDETFDAVWTQNSGMNIADKATLYAGFHRVLRRGGLLATQEPVAGPAGQPYFPMMWASDASSSFLLTGPALRAVVRAARFRERVWEEVTPPPPTPSSGDAGTAPITIQSLVMGDRLPEIVAAGMRSREDGRLAAI